jgi:tRNA(Arg) A34 adenosine deaminase TadA
MARNFDRLSFLGRHDTQRGSIIGMNKDRAPISSIRRGLLAAIGSAALIPGMGIRRGNARQDLTTLSSQPIQQARSAKAESFVNRAFEMRDIATQQGDQAFGAVVVKDGQIIGQSWSRVVMEDDPTGHAEMSAIRDAARRGGRDILDGAVLYSTSHPCSMCEAAAAWVGISRMLHGHDATDAGAPRSC